MIRAVPPTFCDTDAPWDAVVIGAGPAGALAAHQLATRGSRTLVVDAKRFPRSKVCGGCLNRRGIAALEAAELEARPRRNQRRRPLDRCIGSLAPSERGSLCRKCVSSIGRRSMKRSSTKRSVRGRLSGTAPRPASNRISTTAIALITATTPTDQVILRARVVICGRRAVALQREAVAGIRLAGRPAVTHRARRHH